MSRNQGLVAASGMLLAQHLNSITDPGEKMGAVMAFSFNGIVSTAAMMMGSKFNPKEDVFPSMDHVLLATFLINAGCSMSSDASVRVEFSPERMLEALEDFKKYTGRDGLGLIDPILRLMLEKATTVDLSKFGDNRKFLQ